MSGQNHFIKVEDKVVRETKSEKLLGLILDQDLTWKTYLWGENWRDEDNWPGLIPQLTKRVGLIRKLSHTLPKKALKSLATGLFSSKLLYVLPVFGNTWRFLGTRIQEDTYHQRGHGGSTETPKLSHQADFRRNWA